jgi:hypothetical protein
MSTLLSNMRLCRVCLLALVALLQPANSFALSESSHFDQAAQKSSAQSMLELALFHYNSDDLSDKAEQSLKRLLTKEYYGTQESETAQYYLAAYYQRRFYLYREKRGSQDWNSLQQAAAEYRRYTDNYYRTGTHTWLNDSFFNLAMVNFQLGQAENATNELSKMGEAAGRDDTVYIYQVVWSSQSQDVIDSPIPAAKLAEYTKKVFTENPGSFDKAVWLIKKWCQDQRSR